MTLESTTLNIQTQFVQKEKVAATRLQELKLFATTTEIVMHMLTMVMEVVNIVWELQDLSHQQMLNLVWILQSILKLRE